jgi:hypothetical protein
MDVAIDKYVSANSFTLIAHPIYYQILYFFPTNSKSRHVPHYQKLDFIDNIITKKKAYRYTY